MVAYALDAIERLAGLIFIKLGRNWKQFGFATTV
jgi:hypothetical protein